MKKKSISAFKRFFLLAAASALAFSACQLTSSGTTENTVSFTSLYDSLSRYDSVVIEFKDQNGRVLDTVYRGKVDTHAEIENLPVKNWDGGFVLITIVGFDAGVPVYKIEKRFDGRTDKTDTTFILFVPGTGLSSLVSEFQIIEGDSILLPPITVIPATLSDKSLIWTSSQPDAVLINGSFLKAVHTGISQITVKLASNPSKSLTLRITVVPNTRIPDSIAISPKSISLAAAGATLRATVRAVPSSASNAVTWRIEDSAIASVSADGLIQGLRKGNTRLWAYSQEKSTRFDTASISVSDPVPVESILFPRRSIELFVGGAAESLFVDVAPVSANPAVDFESMDPSIAAVKDNRVTGLVEGKTRIVAGSKENPAKTDTLDVDVLSVLHLDSVRVAHPTLPIYTGGESPVLTARVYPGTAPQQIKWRSANNAVATVDDSGKVTAVSPGKVEIYAISQVDSLKKDSADLTVKRDMPQVSVGGDTTISVGQIVSFLPRVTQEYGLVTLFQWDLDGNGSWDGSSDSIKTVSYKYDADSTYLVKFHVKDSEGNDTIVVKRVKAVKGPVVLIQSPLNNSYTNQSSIKVKWTIDETPQDSSPVTLKEGANIITRTAKDAAGNPFSASVTVFLDTTAPNAPNLSGASLTNISPKWKWSTGGGGGSGDFRYKIGNADFTTGAVETRDSLYSLTSATTGSTYTLFVQERDAAGNWSAVASLSIKYDITKPSVTFSSAQSSGTFVATAASIALSGGASGPNAIAKVYYSQDGSTVTTNAVLGTAGAWSIASIPLTEGKTTVITVTAMDVVGNTGDVSLSLLRDNSAPTAPTFISTPQPTIKTALGTWNWAAGNDGATGSGLNGKYQYQLNNSGAWIDPNGASVTDLILKEGNNTFLVQEQDKAGNWSPSAMSTIKVDTKGPALIISAPASAGGTYTETVSPEIPIKGTAMDTGVGVKSVSCALSGATTGNPTVTYAAGSWSVTPVFKSGTTTVSCTAYDNFDNAGASSTIKVVVNVPKPVISNLDVVSGMVTSRRNFTVNYKVTVNGVTTNEHSAVSLADGSNTITLTSTATNVMGESGSLDVKYVLRTNVVFLNANAAGKNDGTSWADGYTDFKNATADPRASAVGAQIWLANGAYACATFSGNLDASTLVLMPSVGLVLGGFDVSSLPSDTTFPGRDPSKFHSALTNYYLTISTLGSKFEFNGVEFDNTKLETDNGVFDGTLVLTNCTIHGMKFDSDHWDISSIAQPIHFQMLGCKVLNDTPGNDEWELFFNSPDGDFKAVNSHFLRSAGAANYFLVLNATAKTITFDNSEINYFIDSGVHQIYVNGDASQAWFINKCQVRGGMGTIVIQTPSNLHYDSGNITLP